MARVAQRRPPQVAPVGRLCPRASRPASSKPRPYDLRHSFVSLLIGEDVSIVEVARTGRSLAGGVPAHIRAHLEEFDPFD